MLRDGGEVNLRDHLIKTAARLIAERGTAGLAVRDITRAAQVADGVLYNYFEDKEDLLAHALLTHVGAVMSTTAPMPVAGAGTLAGNLREFVDNGLQVLIKISPAFAGLVSQPKVLTRFRAMIGGNAAFGVSEERASEERVSGERASGDRASGEPASGEPASGERAFDEPENPQGLPDMLTVYLRAEQRLGRVDAAADVVAAARVIVGAIHGQVLPPLLFNAPGTAVTVAPDFAERLVTTILTGIAHD